MAKSVLSVTRETKSLARRLYAASTGKIIAGQYVQSTCCGLGSNPVWIAYCVQLYNTPAPWGWLSEGYKKIINFSPMNKNKSKAEKGRCVQRNQTACESRGLVSGWLWARICWSEHTGFLWLEGRWILGASSSSWRVGWEPLGWKMLQDQNHWDGKCNSAHCSKGVLWAQGMLFH